MGFPAVSTRSSGRFPARRVNPVLSFSRTGSRKFPGAGWGNADSIIPVARVVSTFVEHRAQLLLALRVLSALCIGRVMPTRRDTKALRKLAQTEAERSMPLDDLARLVVVRACNPAFAERTN